MNQTLKERLTKREHWIRALWMLLFALIFNLAELVIAAVVILQFGIRLFTGTTNRQLLDFGASLSRYAYQLILYLTYNTESRPFPFSDWPEDDIP